MEHKLSEGDVLIIRAFDDVPEHRFQVTAIYEDCVGGYALTGPLAGHYGEPALELIQRVLPTKHSHI